MKRKKINFPIFEPEKCALFALGRNAMYTACRSLGLKPGDLVLTPALDCDSTLTPFRVLGLKPVYYRSDPYTYQADQEDIKKRITPDVKLLHVINHFGFPQPWESLMEIRKETGIPILEDNAYSFFSAYKGQVFGTFGDYAVYSLYKIFPILDGGMLRCNRTEPVIKLQKRKQQWFYATERRKVLALALNRLGYNRLPQSIKNRISSAGQPMPPLYSDKPGYPHWHLRDKILPDFVCDFQRPISKIAERQLDSFSQSGMDDINTKTRQYYQYLVNQLEGIPGITLLWPRLPNQIIPYCLSILFDSHRDDILFSLKADKYSVIAWPTFSGDVIEKTEEYPEVKIIGKKILQILIPFTRVAGPDPDQYFKNLAIAIIKASKMISLK